MKAGVFLIVVLYWVTIFTTAANPRVEFKEVDISQLPGYDQATTDKLVSYAGYMHLENDNKAQIFFWFFENPVRESPIIVWFNGGPGCSSLVGVFVEHGPFRFETATKVTKNEFSLHKFAHTIYIDNPCGAGYSVGTNKNKYPATAITAMDDVYEGLKLLFAHPDFKDYKNNDFYPMGESYGGKYSIALANRIDQDKLKGISTFNLKGMGLGNGWVHPDVHQRVYTEMAYGFGIYNYHEVVANSETQQSCHKLVMAGQYKEADEKYCTPAWMKTLDTGGGFNPYDVRLLGSYPFLRSLSLYLSSDAIKNMLGVPPKTPFHLCNDELFDAFLVEFQKNYVTYLPHLLKQYKVLVFTGQFDLRCSILGVNEWVRLLDWEGKDTFNYMQNEQYIIRNETRGLFKAHKNLVHAILYGAGHLTPLDQPELVSDMLSRFVKTSSLCGATPSGSCRATRCPYSCSNHGRCVNAVCKCNAGFYGESCSISKHELVFGRTKYYNGYIFGNQINTYQMFVGEGSRLYDLQITISKTKPFGKLHIYAHGGTDYIVPDITYIDLLAERFPYRNTEDTDTRTMYINNLPRHNNTHITLVVLNTVDIESEYTISIKSDISGKRVDTALIGSILLFSGLTIATLVLAVIAVLQFMNDSRFYRSLKNYRTEVHEIDEEDFIEEDYREN